MSLTLALVSRTEVERYVRTKLAATGPALSVTRALIAGQLRAGCYGSQPDGQSELVHSSRLAVITRRNLASLLPEIVDGEGDVVLDVLDQLARIGDLFSPGQGKWVPAPPRLVRAPDGTSALVLGAWGAMPKIPVSSEGVARYTASVSVGADAPPHIEQTSDQWLGLSEPLLDWTARLLRVATRKLVAADIDAKHLEVFAPDQHRAQGRLGWWLPAGDLSKASSGLRLCRPVKDRSAAYDRPYYLGEFAVDGGVCVLRRSAPIAYAHTRRLRYGLEATLGVPRVVRAVSAGEVFEVEMPLDFPDPEERVSALGWAKDTAVSSPKRVLQFPQQALSFVRAAFDRLHVDFRLDDKERR